MGDDVQSPLGKRPWTGQAVEILAGCMMDVCVLLALLTLLHEVLGISPHGWPVVACLNYSNVEGLSLNMIAALPGM